jgi:uncharacterized protein (TIGR03435 family)
MPATTAHAQVALPAFEVASAKPHPAASGIFPLSCVNGRLISVGTPMYSLIFWAYDLRYPQSAELEEQLPAWTKRADGVYDIEAKSEGAVSEVQCRLMLQTLLAERFKFAAHRETKEGSVYDLLVAPGGHKLQLMADSDTALGFKVTINGRGVRIPPGAPVLKGVTTGDLAKFLAGFTPDRLLVIDRTGLEGQFKIDLSFSSDPLEFPDPDLGTALLKQLGLKLERRKGLVEHFVLDHIERPDSN